MSDRDGIDKARSLGWKERLADRRAASEGRRIAAQWRTMIETLPSRALKPGPQPVRERLVRKPVIVRN